MAMTSGSIFVFDRLGRDVPEGSQLLIDNAAFAISALIVGIIGMVADPYIHRLTNGGIFDAPMDKGTISPSAAKKIGGL